MSDREIRLLDRASDLFVDDSDVIQALSDFSRGHISANELKDRLIYLKIQNDIRAENELDRTHEDIEAERGDFMNDQEQEDRMIG